MEITPLERVQAISDVAYTIRGQPVMLAPQLEDYDLLQQIRRPIKFPHTPDFLIVLNMDRFLLREVQLKFPDNNILELNAEHENRPDNYNIIFSRSLNYKWILPASVPFNCLQAQWTSDNFLIIISTQFHVPTKTTETDIRSVRLVPQRTTKALRPSIDLSVVRDMIEDIRDKAQHTLRFVRLRVGDSDAWDSTVSEPADEPQVPPEDVSPVPGTSKDSQ